MRKSSAIKPISHLLIARVILGGFLFCSTLAISHAKEWEKVTMDGREYVTAESIKAFYKFETMEKTGDSLELTQRNVTMKLTTGSRTVFLNNIKFIFHSKILTHEGQYLVSTLDVTMIIDPVLRPDFVKSAKACKTVIIDPGHGGTDPGAQNAFGKEKDYTLAVARLLKKDLEAKDFEVVMTRDADVTLSNAERVKIANGVASDAIFISIHFKSEPGKNGTGIETITCLYPRDGETRTGADQQIASIALATSVHGMCVAKMRLPDGGIRSMNTSVLAGIKHPAILLIGGNMSNPRQATFINQDRYPESLATLITYAVTRYRSALGRHRR